MCIRDRNIAKEAAEKFVETMLPAGTANRVGLVSFAGVRPTPNNKNGIPNYTVPSDKIFGLTNSQNSMLGNVRNIEIDDEDDYHTHYTGALQAAYNMLNSRSEADLSLIHI